MIGSYLNGRVSCYLVQQESNIISVSFYIIKVCHFVTVGRFSDAHRKRFWCAAKQVLVRSKLSEGEA